MATNFDLPTFIRYSGVSETDGTIAISILNDYMAMIRLYCVEIWRSSSSNPRDYDVKIGFQATKFSGLLQT